MFSTSNLQRFKANDSRHSAPNGLVERLVWWLLLRYRLHPSRAECVAILGTDLLLYRETNSSRFTVARRNKSKGAILLTNAEAARCADLIERHRNATLGREGLPNGFRERLNRRTVLQHDDWDGGYALAKHYLRRGGRLRPPGLSIDVDLGPPRVSLALTVEEADAMASAILARQTA